MSDLKKNMKPYGRRLTDEDPMPFGKYKGEKMTNVPAEYLLWLYNEDIKPGSVRDYIEDNLDAIRSEVEYKGNAGAR